MAWRWALLALDLAFSEFSEPSGPSDLATALLSGLRRATAFDDAELRRWASELAALPAPRAASTWRGARCGEGASCAAEAVQRLVAQLAEAQKLPVRGFELFPGDPHYELWKASDVTPFHSWVTGEAAEESLEALVPEGQALAMGRLQASSFTWKAKAVIQKLLGPASDRPNVLGRCLEWDTPHYIIKAFGGLCSKFDILQYADGVTLTERLESYPKGTRVMRLDVLRPPEWMPTDYGLVLCYFVLEHVPDPHRAMRGIVQLLKPGGYLLLGAPFVDGVHGCPSDFFRYTPHGLRKVTEPAGLEVLVEYAPGHPVIAAGELMGMKSSYWDTEDILRDSDTHPMNVFLLARKPLLPGHRRPWTHYNQTS